MGEVPGFDRAEYPLFRVSLETWQGFLFTSLAAEPAPLAASYGRYDERFAAWGLESLRAGSRIEYDVRANWKLIVENYSDCYHCRAVHPELNRRSDYRNGSDDVVEGFLLGGYMWMNEPGARLTRSGRSCAPTLSSVAGDDLNRAYYFGFFPNLLLSLTPEYVMAHTLWPLAPDRTRVICEWLFDSHALEAGECEPRDAVAFWDQANREDWEACERTQRGVASRAYVPGPACGEFEKLVVAFDQEVLKALGR
jgi:Rieske 2Fe-2S family protein